LQSEVYSEIERLADRIGEIEGVVGVVLFGSYSRGDFDEGSDVDLLVVFKDKSTLRRRQEEVYKITAETDLPIQAIPLTVRELKESALLEPVVYEGKILRGSKGLRRLLAGRGKPYALISYENTGLAARERVAFTQKLEGRRVGRYRYYGILQENGGFKVGRGALMIPLKNMRTITEFLEENRVEYMIRYVWTY